MLEVVAHRERAEGEFPARPLLGEEGYPHLYLLRCLELLVPLSCTLFILLRQTISAPLGSDGWSVGGG